MASETQHEVTLTQPFYMGQYAVTQAQYEQVMGYNPSAIKGAMNPVTHVSWDDGCEFCKKLSAQSHLGVRLPTEAEWEYACRAGAQTSFHTGDTERDLDSVGWFGANSGGVDHPVGRKEPNAWGLYDLHGNVEEWCLDWHGAQLPNAVTDPVGPATGTSRVLRGGAYYRNSKDCRCASRNYVEPEYRSPFVGFRVVCSVAPHTR